MQTIIPVEDIRNLPIPDLALSLLRVLGGRSEANANNTLRGLEQAMAANGVPDLEALLGRVASAWAWLDAHALLGPHPRQTGSEWRRVTEMGRLIANDPTAVARIWAEDRLGGELDPSLETARMNLALGDFETAVFSAMKAVEVEVRHVAGLPNELLGVPLMRKAFNPSDGVLSDPTTEGGERQSTMDLFAGAIGLFKNPASHRSVEFEDPVEAAEAIQLADLLLRIVHRAERRLAISGD